MISILLENYYQVLLSLDVIGHFEMCKNHVITFAILSQRGEIYYQNSLLEGGTVNGWCAAKCVSNERDWSIILRESGHVAVFPDSLRNPWKCRVSLHREVIKPRTAPRARNEAIHVSLGGEQVSRTRINFENTHVYVSRELLLAYVVTTRRPLLLYAHVHEYE